MSMGGRSYTVAVELVDKNGVLQRLDNLQKNGVGGAISRASGGGGGGSNGSSGGGIWDRIRELNITQVAKLAGIGVGVGALVGLAQKSSGILQGTMKMWERNFMLFVKPLGDFIGLVFRPIALALLSNFILPFYKTVFPWVRDVGKMIGDFFMDPSNKLASLAVAIGGAVAAALLAKSFWDKLKELFGDAGTGTGGGGDCDCGGKGTGSDGCIRLCDTPSVPTPNTVPTPMPVPIPIPQTDPMTTPNPSGFPNPWNMVPGPFFTGHRVPNATPSFWNQVPGPFNTNNMPTPNNIPTIPMPVPSSSTNHGGFWFGSRSLWESAQNPQPSPFIGPQRPEGLGAPNIEIPSINPAMDGIVQEFDEALAQSVGISGAVEAINKALTAAAAYLNSRIAEFEGSFAGRGGGTTGIRPFVTRATTTAAIADTIP